MSAIANTQQTYGVKGIREDLADVIYNISPEETPFVSSAGRGKAPNNTYFEWQTDTLASVDNTNARVEGDDKTSFSAAAATSRIGNYTQISDKTVIVAGTLEAVDKAGRASEEAYQLAKRGAELKRDIENILCGTNQGAVAGNSTTARLTGGLLAFIKTNTVKGVGGADPVYTTTPSGVRTDGTQVAFTETMLKTLSQQLWAAGGKLDTLMVGGLQKQVVSGFAGIATKTITQVGAKKAVIVGAADIYVSDFGNLVVMPNRFQRNRDAFLIDWDMVSVRYLRPIQRIALAKTGDAEKRLLLAEYGLQVNQEAGLALAADLS